MPFVAQISFIIVLSLLNILAYIWTFPNSFATQNKDFYDIISIFNDFIFISCVLSSISSLRKAKFQTATFFLSIPLIYTVILILNFR
ncbi:MAG: hypothetical protein J6V53_01100 [Alphaproteobacteria bacterium]|nr:hypothetical protein [Alphaproteobacteria bacterium]